LIAAVDFRSGHAASASFPECEAGAVLPCSAPHPEVRLARIPAGTFQAVVTCRRDRTIHLPDLYLP